ncbi:hypothetical protein [Epilithonimonas arachidiradicis]|uniref:Uncharacterized protein n=1 Tax=Epilithonimonas arachidiradicis TaxID=1617282 RepID=A0A420DC73_9FLAO|nr:hypothetical protein [Epilithonimonas arachidiradicis]RKE89530.1 hypothetical protein BXY58_0093 [Epilithonimonas arachidiradicis]GGG43186.1 hypothetical protein GCM10007332_00870 [Epilithonimonas arachidiradicis]
MKKLIAGGLMIFGAMFVTAQVTPPQDTSRTNKTSKEKKMDKMNQKAPQTVQPNGMNRTVDTATINNRSKMQSNPDRLRQKQTLPDNGTMQSPNNTLPNNGTLQNPSPTNPNNSTNPQQPLGPNSPTNPNPPR